MIKITFTEPVEIIRSTSELYQWDTGQVLEISGLGVTAAPDIHFTFHNMKHAFVVKSELANGKIKVEIPNKILTYGKDIIAYICTDDSDKAKATLTSVIIPVRKRNMPDNYYYTDEEDATTVDRVLAETERATTVEKSLSDKIGLNITDIDVLKSATKKQGEYINGLKTDVDANKEKAAANALVGANNKTELESARSDVTGEEHPNLKTRLDTDYNNLNDKIEVVKESANALKTINLYKDLTTLTLGASTGAANAYLYSAIFDKGYVENITITTLASGTVKLYLYKLENDRLIPFDMFYISASKGENIINVKKEICDDFYVGFASYNNAKICYAEDTESTSNNTKYIDAGEPTTNKFDTKYYFGVSVNYGKSSEIWGYINDTSYKKSLFLNVPVFALTQKASTGAANAYFIFDKFNKGYIKRIYIREIEAGSVTITLYRIAGNKYVPFKYYTKTAAVGDNYIDVEEYIYTDFYISINGKCSFIDKTIGSNNTKWVDNNTSLETSITPAGKYYFGVYFEYENKDVEKYKKRIYNLQDAFMAWSSGKKFPVCFAGDSTTDGYQTTGYKANSIGTDHILPNIYTKLLEDYLKTEIPANSSIRIYNAGFSGKTADWFNANFDAEILKNENYVDTMMIGLSFGINDRPTNDIQYNTVKSNFEEIIKKCYENGIQPFLLTCQAGLENSTRVARREWITMSYANKIIYDLANEYNLELIDVSKLTHKFITYSDIAGEEISADRCHFNDKGHQYEAGMFFAHFVPRVMWIDGAAKIGFDAYGLKSDLSSDANAASEIKMLDTITNGFKMRASMESTSDKIVMDIWVFVDAKNKLTLKSYCGEIYSQYVVVDGVTYNLANQEQTITNLDLGLHRITVHSGTGDINFYGFKLV